MYEVWFTTTTGGTPMSRQSKRETASIDDGSGNKKATILLFGRFTGKKAPSNSLKDWIEAQDSLAQDILKAGYECGKPGIRRIARENIENTIDSVASRMVDIGRARDRFISDLPQLRQQILDSYASDPCLYEVEEALARFHPNPTKMTPTFGVSDLMKGTGLVPSQQVQDAIIKTDMETNLRMVSLLEEELKDIFERCDSPDRVRGQLAAVEGLLTRLEPLIKDFSTSPDLVENLAKGLKVLKALPKNADALKGEEGQAVVKEGLAIFETQPTMHEVYDGVGGYDHTPDDWDPCPECGGNLATGKGLLGGCNYCGGPMVDPLPYPDVEPEVIGKPITELMSQKFTPEVANDDFF